MFFYNEISPTRETECAHELENSHQQVMLLRIGVVRQENNLTSLQWSSYPNIRFSQPTPIALTDYAGSVDSLLS